MFFSTFVATAGLFASLVAGLPRPDSSSGDEVAVSAPNGIVLSDTAALASQLATESAMMMTVSSSSYAAATTTNNYAPPVMTTMATYGGSYGGSYTSMTSSAAYATATYGSGSTMWNSPSYESCVQQCVASFGGPPAMYTPSPSYNGNSGGSGTTHTVIVAPTQGVLRYVPFAVNASVGDTVHFVWHANNHTVTKSSELQICNKTSDSPFASGTQNEGFTFDQVVNDTNPTFFYCGTPTHCEKGMFGIINPPNALAGPSSVGSMMPSLVSNNSNMAPMYSYTNSQTQGSYAASNWGSGIDMSSMPSWSYQYAAENVLYTRTFMAANPDVINPDGSINMNTGAPLVFPADLSSANNAAAASGSPATPSSTGGSSSPTSNAAPSTSSPASGHSSANAAVSTVASRGLLTVVAFAAAFIAL